MIQFPRGNYRRGFLRIYVILSILWLATLTWASTDNRPRPVGADPSVNMLGESREKKSWSFEEIEKAITKEEAKQQAHDKYVEADKQYRRYWPMMAAVTLGPPAACYVTCFVMLPWVSRGFASRLDK